jgi:SAM-dependent methyltransferase
MSLDTSVHDRYSKAAVTPEPGLCCPVDYDTAYLDVIPTEVLERDYGCGDPVSHVREGEVVLDLGSGSGKVCFIAAQLAGRTGRVIGIDINDDMLALARNAQDVVADRLGYDNVSFVKGRIEDLQLDCELVDERLRSTPVADFATLQRLHADLDDLREEETLIPSGSIDLVISNCVLNLVSPDAKRRLFSELHRVLKPGGRAVISDIVCDEEVPEPLREDPHLWSGCYSGALREDVFVKAFADAGLYGITVLERDVDPWQVIEGIEFRSVTVAAYKGKEGFCWDHQQAVVYKGPFKRVEDDDGHAFERGARAAVCEKTLRILTSEPYNAWFEAVQPVSPPTPAEVKPFPCGISFFERDPRETKGTLPLGASAPAGLFTPTPPADPAPTGALPRPAPAETATDACGTGNCC